MPTVRISSLLQYSNAPSSMLVTLLGIVTQGLKDLGYGDIVNTDFKYTFTDTLGNEITAEVR